MRSHARVVVIGGGAVGAACLYHLAQAGVTDCLLVEKDELTSGSTWHAAGNIPTYANSWLGMRAGNYAWRLYSELGEMVDSPITYRHTGAFWPAQTHDRMDFYRHLVGVSRSAGFELAMLTPAEMESIHPWYRAAGVVIGGIHDPYEGDIDPSQLTQALAKGARDLGTEIARFTKVTSISRTPTGEWQVETDKGGITCEVIVNATGFYGDEIGRMVGERTPVAVLEHQYLVTEPLQELAENTELFPLVRDPDIRFYLRREGDGLLFGSYGHDGRLAFAGGLPESFAHSLFEDSVDDISEVLTDAITHVPILEKAGVRRFVNGPIGYSPDALPLCGPASGLPNFYHACGIQIGITHSAAVGKAIAEWVTSGETEWDYSAWDPRRFGSWADPDYCRQRIVELYGLQYAIPYPHRLLEAGRPVNATPLYDSLASKGAVFGQIGGWERAFWFSEGSGEDHALSFRRTEAWRESVARECRAVRDAAGIMDHGGFTKYEVRGEGAEAFLQKVFCTRLPAEGRVRLSYMLTPSGKIYSEATIARTAPDRYLLCGPTLADLGDYDWLRSHLPGDESVTLTRGFEMDGALLLMGPKSREILACLTATDVQALPWLSVGWMNVAGIDVLAMRVSFVGEMGFEMHVRSSDLLALYSAIDEAGQQYGLKDFGSYALNSMRIEKAYHGWGADFGVEYNLFDAGLGGFLDRSRDDFIGAEATARQSGTEPEWRFVRLLVDSAEADPLAGDPILLNDECIGYITSAAFGYRLDQCVALGYIENRVPGTHTEFELQVLGERCKAILSDRAFYDPSHSRCRD